MEDCGTNKKVARSSGLLISCSVRVILYDYLGIPQLQLCSNQMLRNGARTSRCVGKYFTDHTFKRLFSRRIECDSLSIKIFFLIPPNDLFLESIQDFRSISVACRI